MHTVLECSRNSYECFLCLLCSSTFCLCIFLLWSNILSQKLYFLYMDLLHLSQQASYSTLVRDYEGDMLVDLEGDMQSALFLMQWLLHPFAAVETSKIIHALRLHKSRGDLCLHWYFKNYACQFLWQFLQYVGYAMVLSLRTRVGLKSLPCVRTFMNNLSAWASLLRTYVSKKSCVH